MRITRASRRVKTRRTFSAISGDRGYGVVESLIVLIVLCVLVVVFLWRIEDTVYAARVTAVRAELGSLRGSIQFFKVTKGRFPKALSELIETEYVAPYQDVFFKTKYLEPTKIDEEKNVLDPRGNPYAYNPVDGTVHSTSSGFEDY